jgi:NADH-quinone oxidoreductase subunit M
MVSHGIVSAALFLCVGVVYDRMHSRETDLRRPRQPHAGLCRGVHAVHHDNVGLPGTSGFVGEF